jgi:hypothetical protein
MKATKIYAICCALAALLLVPMAFGANTVGTATVFPAITVPGGTVTIHTTEGSSAAQPVKVTISVVNPGSCVVGKIPTFVGSLQMNLKPGVLRNGTISLTTPAAACAGTYTVKVSVVNTTTNTILATHTTSFKISPGQH